MLGVKVMSYFLSGLFFLILGANGLDRKSQNNKNRFTYLNFVLIYVIVMMMVFVSFFNEYF